MINSSVENAAKPGKKIAILTKRIGKSTKTRLPTVKLNFCGWNCKPTDTKLFAKFLDQKLEAARNVITGTF